MPSIRRSDTITGIDIGSSRICAVMADRSEKAPGTIRGVQSAPVKGVERGEIVDLDLAVDSLSRVLTRLEEKCGRKARSIYVNISGSSIRAQKARGMVPLSTRGREITESDMKRCVGVASTIRLAFDTDIIHKVVHSYLIDDQTETVTPAGLYGSRLGVEIYVITASVSHLQNLEKLLHHCGRSIDEVVFTGCADAAALLDVTTKQIPTFIVDIGSSLTEVSFFSGGTIFSIDIFSRGVIDLRGPVDADEVMQKIADRVREKAAEFAGRGIAGATIVFTGGGAFVDGVIEFFEARTGLAARRETVKGLHGNITASDAALATTAVGLVRYAEERMKPQPQLASKRLGARLTARAVDFFNNYF